MIILAILFIAFFLFGVFVVGVNNSLKKQNEELVAMNTALRDVIKKDHEHLKKLSNMEAMAAMREIWKVIKEMEI
jgi:hypothetical protein